jgi:DNA-directed RNA polymerase subunit beta
MSLPQAKRMPLVSNAELDKDIKLKRPERVWFSRIPTVLEMPRLIQTQIDSFEWFKREGLRELLPL